MTTKQDIIQITEVNDPRVAVFRALTDSPLLRRQDGSDLFIAESPKVINVALDAGLRPVSVLCEDRHITGDAAGLLERCPAEMPLYTGTRQVLSALTGYTLTRGVLCAMEKPQLPSPQQICHPGARRVLVMDGINDATNVGAIFRSAAALGVDGVLVTKSTCNPLNRRSVRVSMGNVFLVPWTVLEAPLQSLNDYGFKTVAMALTDRSVSIDDPALNAEPRLAIVVGEEGDGLSPAVIAASDYTARIPMHNHVDSLNVATAAAIAFWQLR